MKSLLWKELRETAKWGALPLLLFGGIMIVYGPRPCINEMFLGFVSLVGAVFGGTIGYLQLASEARGDRRALLLHRPLNGSSIFLMKAIVGVGVCLVALGFPFAVNAVLAATPGQIAEPFRWPALLPWLADILTGLVYYFAGLLAAQRPGRWYASRCLGFATAFVATLLVWNVPEFWQALAAIFLLGGLLAAAAWGSFLAGGEYETQPMIAKLALSLSLLIGLIEIGIEAKSMLGTYLADSTTKYFDIDRSGRIVLVHQLPNRELRVTDPDCRDLPEFEPKDLASSEALQEKMAVCSSGALARWRSYRIPGRLYVPYANDSIPRGERWFFAVDRGRLIGYDSRAMPIGTIGPAGFALVGDPSPDRFAGPIFFPSSSRWVFSPDYLAFPYGVYDIDFRRREATKIFSPAHNETVLWATRWSGRDEDESLALVCTNTMVHVLDNHSRDVLSAPLAYDVRQFTDVRLRVLENPRRYLVSYGPGLELGLVARQTLAQHYVEYDAAGNEIDRRSAPAWQMAKVSPWQCCFGLVTPPAEWMILLGTTRRELFGSVANPGFELNPLSYHALHKELTILPDSLKLQHGVGDNTVATYFSLSLISASLCSLVCYYLARRAAFSRGRRIAWAACGLFFGPVGILLLFAIEQWPARIACPACGRLRVVNRDNCEHCSALHMLPRPDGTEVFESAADLQQPVHEEMT